MKAMVGRTSHLREAGTMRATQLFGGDLRETVVADPPEPSNDQVQITIDSCGICGSDLSLARDTEKFVGVARRGRFEMAAFDTSRPVVPGHEFAGTVAVVGDGVTDYDVGDRVAGIGVVTEADGAMTIIGFSNDYPGGFAERVTVDAAWLRHVPEALSLEAASLAEPLHVGETHVQQSAIEPQDVALVIGAGTIGLGVVVALAARECPLIVVVEPSPRRRELARNLGAHVATPPPGTGPVAAIAEVADGRRVIAYECSGRAGTIRDLTESLPYGSAIQLVASPFSEETFIPVIAQWRQLTINFGSGPVDDPYGVTLGRLADGSIDPDLFITGRVGLGGVSAAFSDLRDPEGHVKILVKPGMGT